MWDPELTRFRQTQMFIIGIICFCFLFAFALIFHYLINVRTDSDYWINYSQESVTYNKREIITLIEDAPKDSNETSIVCYYNSPSDFNDSAQLQPIQIPSNLCTHINIAFAQVVNKSIALIGNVGGTIQQVVKLKVLNPNLKVLLSIGGAGADNGYNEMVVDHASRKEFIKSIKYFLKYYKLDGVDLDWEFPVYHHAKLAKRERQHFSQLLREIRAEYIREKKNYLLSVAVAAPRPIVELAYDVDQLNLYTDYVNIMTYDYHLYSTYTPFTGLNSPLYGRPEEILYMSTLNINYTVQMYIGKGLSPNKIVVGIPTYGHTFHLVNSENTQIGSPASGYGDLGSLGFIDYTQVCKFIEDNHKLVFIERDTNGKVPYLHKDLEWISYDDVQSVIEKAKYVKENNLGGAMIYSLNSDDFRGACLISQFPLVNSIRNHLLGNFND